MNTRISALLAACTLLSMSLPASADITDLDEARSGWKVRRSVTVTAAGQTAAFAALPLPPEVAAAAQPDLRDLRLIGADGRETPFVVDRITDRKAARHWDGDLTDTRSDKKLRTVWTVDFRESRRFDTIELRIDDRDFAKRFRVEASEDSTGWRELIADAGIFDRQWNFRVHHTVIRLPSPQTARYLRLTADDQRSAPISIRGVTARIVRDVAGERWSRRADIGQSSDEKNMRRYRLDLPPGLPIERVEIESDDPAFSRRVVLMEEREVSGRQTRVRLGGGGIYRLKLEDDGLSGEDLWFPVNSPRSGRLVLEMQNNDSPPLRNLRVTVSGVASRVLFPFVAAAGPWTLYYGNTATRAAVYDLEMLKTQLGLNPRFITAELGSETPNSRYRPVPPMQFVASHGAPLEARQWKMARALTLPKVEDIYTVTLAAADLAVLRPDLGDLRVVSGSGRQIPFILEADAAEAEVALRIEPDTRPAKRSQRGAVSRYRITVTDVNDKPMTLPLQQLRLTVAEAFFSRPATLTAPSRDPRHGDHVLFSGELSRQAGQRGPVQLNLDADRYNTLFLQIEEGDNAPLTIEKVCAIVRVPRVVFKLKSDGDSYRLLLGNERAQSPRYDIQSLRREVLAYSAVPASLASLEPNPAHRRSAADYFQSAPPTLALWGVLLVAVVGLLVLTVRLLKKTPV
ncbi:MAG: DUF3999 family protein [Verrucomicrobia bacterium]|nr:DUF3999 family protein [Verrucomicrobiota bacterium]